jgi:hypothetical protein
MVIPTYIFIVTTNPMAKENTVHVDYKHNNTKRKVPRRYHVEGGGAGVAARSASAHAFQKI